MKSTIIRIRCQPDARSAIEAKAKAAGLPLGPYMRRSALGGKMVAAARIADEQWIELGGALTALRSAVKLLEHRKGEGQVDLLVDLVAETCVHVEGIRGILINEQGV